MHSDSNPSVAVVGAAGLVGRALLHQLEELDIKVTAVVRGLPELSVDGDFHFACSQPSALAGDGFDIVINLAYPTSGQSYDYPQQNAEIVHTVQGLVKDRGRLIQVSTLAVFGLALDRTISAGPVSKTRDNAYVESKIAAELLFLEQQAERGLSLDVVRLGNVWGYASGTWAVPVVQRLVTGRPVGIVGAVGHSNTTDVVNVASYLAFLIQAGDRRAGVRYHHLAEFSGVRWSEWIEPIAQAMSIEPLYADRSVLDAPASRAQEMAEVLAPLRLRSVYRKLSDERITGSWARTLVRQLPTPMRSRMKSSGLVFAADPEYGRAEQTFLAIMAGQHEFRSVVHPEWKPALTKEQSLDSVLLWLDRG